MCGILIFVLGNAFVRLAFGEEIIFHRPWDARESHNISIQELFGPYFVFLCNGEVHEAMFFVVSVPTNGSGVACNVVIWFSFLSIKFSSKLGKMKHDSGIKEVSKCVLLTSQVTQGRNMTIGKYEDLYGKMKM